MSFILLLILFLSVLYPIKKGEEIILNGNIMVELLEKKKLIKIIVKRNICQRFEFQVYLPRNI